MLRIVLFCGLLTFAILFPGCHSTHEAHATGPSTTAFGALDGLTHAIVVLSPTEGNRVRGTVKFSQHGDRVRVVAHISGLEPNATHAWHIHEYGDISSPDGTATGGHYNPEGHAHALPTTPMRHAGDLGNLTADGSGHAHAEMTVENITIGGSMNPVIGRAVIVHAKADDGGQPTGNAGARIAQGVIGIAKSP